MNLFDSHAHLDAQAFDADRNEVLAAARKAGVCEMLVPAIAVSDWKAVHDLCAAEADLHPAYGLHPLYLPQHSDRDLVRLREWLRAHGSVALGECGLDFHDSSLDRERQLHFLREQLRLAREFDLPLVLHARAAFEQVILELRKFDGLRGVVHSFSGSAEQARRLWEMGFMIGIGGPVTYDRARRLRRIVAEMPIEFLLLETDSPDQPDAAHRGRRNEPARLPEVLRCVAELRDCAPAEIARATTANARSLFTGRT
ncbi:MAG TPA: TatD family hydrolase [Rhodanobacteraceae bacterium]|nr:TatD family hydrolase [Rhodanobacteraceae bacterium]